MKIIFSQRAATIRDAGEVAFGILVFAILIFAFAILAGAVTAAVAPVEWGRSAFWIATFTWWFMGMIPILIRYKRATCGWDGERRGTNILVLVEFITAVTKALTDLVARTLTLRDDGNIYALMLFLSVFVLLLAGSHIITYALLRYKPKRKELGVWLCITVTFLAEYFLAS